MTIVSRRLQHPFKLITTHGTSLTACRIGSIVIQLHHAPHSHSRGRIRTCTWHRTNKFYYGSPTMDIWSQDQYRRSLLQAEQTYLDSISQGPSLLHTPRLPTCNSQARTHQLPSSTDRVKQGPPRATFRARGQYHTIPSIVGLGEASPANGSGSKLFGDRYSAALGHLRSFNATVKEGLGSLRHDHHCASWIRCSITADGYDCRNSLRSTNSNLDRFCPSP